MMRILFAGTPEVAVPSLHRLVEAGHEVVGVLTQPDGRGRRGAGTILTPVKKAAIELLGPDIPILQPDNLRDDETLAAIRALSADVIPVVAYGNLVPQAALDIVPFGWINLHFSLLPRWRGAAPVQRCIEAGDALTGASIFRIEAGLDTGPVYATLTHELTMRDTAGDLLDVLSISGARLLAEVISGLSTGAHPPVEQSSEGATHAAKINPAQAQIDWAESHEKVHRLIRAVTPAPGAWTLWRGERFKVISVDPSGPIPSLDNRLVELAPGVPALIHKQLWVGTGSQPLNVTAVAPAGKARMDGAAWLRGSRHEVHEKFESAPNESTPVQQGSTP